MNKKELMMESPQKKKMVVIDDDPIFHAILEAVAGYEGFEYEGYESLDEMGTFARLRDYDIAVLDYSMPVMTGVEIAEYIDVFFEGLPVLLISSENLLSAKNQPRWPGCIVEFRNKIVGVGGIIDAAKSILARPAEGVF
jgi:CheY-like chemotaxis protein